MSRLVGLSCAEADRCSPDNPLGWARWLIDEGERIATINRAVELCQSVGTPAFSGVFLAASCGKIDGGVYVGTKTDGDKAYSWWAGHTDSMIHEVVREFAARDVLVYTSIGLPRDIAGLEALETDMETMPPNVEIAFDITGSNESWMVDAAINAAGTGRSRLESRPLPGAEVSRRSGLLFITMAARARKLLQLGVEFSGDIIVYNAGKDRNRWNAAEAPIHERRGNTVVQPLKFIA